MPASGENRRRIAREYGRRNRAKMSAYQATIMPSGLSRQEEYRKNSPEVILKGNASGRARRAGKPFRITLQDIKEMLKPMICAVPTCQRKLEIGHKKNPASVAFIR